MIIRPWEGSDRHAFSPALMIRTNHTYAYVYVHHFAWSLSYSNCLSQRCSNVKYYTKVFVDASLVFCPRADYPPFRLLSGRHKCECPPSIALFLVRFSAGFTRIHRTSCTTLITSAIDTISSESKLSLHPLCVLHHSPSNFPRQSRYRRCRRMLYNLSCVPRPEFSTGHHILRHVLEQTALLLLCSVHSLPSNMVLPTWRSWPGRPNSTSAPWPPSFKRRAGADTCTMPSASLSSEPVGTSPRRKPFPRWGWPYHR